MGRPGFWGAAEENQVLHFAKDDNQKCKYNCNREDEKQVLHSVQDDNGYGRASRFVCVCAATVFARCGGG
jgi:hypothetical protein